jgi:uncharacterized protein (DUF58 family)
MLGLVKDKSSEGEIEYLTVYPRVLPLQKFSLASRIPMGMIKFTHPVFEDPSRPTGKREYQIGDSMRRIDWKATASAGKLQVKNFEPTISLETALFLNLNQDEFVTHERIDAMEFAIVAAASIANWVIQKKQSVGLYTNGIDQFNESDDPTIITPHKGRQHLMHVLESLARIKTTHDKPFLPFLKSKWRHLVWGTTLVIITGKMEQSIFEELTLAKKGGINPVIILCGNIADVQKIKAQSKQIGIPLVQIYNENDLMTW